MVNGTHSKLERQGLLTKRLDKLVSVSELFDYLKPLTSDFLYAGEMVIFNMREKRKSYNLLSNNCQNFALFMLDVIQIGAHKQFATSLAVYQRATGAGKVSDLFVEKLLYEPTDQDAQMPELKHQNTVETAQQVMDENTTKLDDHHSLFAHA